MPAVSCPSAFSLTHVFSPPLFLTAVLHPHIQTQQSTSSSSFLCNLHLPPPPPQKSTTYLTCGARPLPSLHPLPPAIEKKGARSNPQSTEGVRINWPPRSTYSERPPRSSYSDTRIEIDTHRHHHHHHRPESRPAIPYSPIDNIERGYRARSQPGYREDVRVTETTVDAPLRRPVIKETVRHDEHIIEAPKIRPAVNQTVRVDETVEIDRSPRHKHHHKAKMGYFDEDGHYHSFRHGLHKVADRIIHPQGRETIEVTEVRESRPSRRVSQAAYGDEAPNSVTIPCHHIRIGDILILQGRISQVIRISTSSATGQHRYLGVDLFTKQLHEESSSIHNPAPSVVVQTMRGPILKQYRVLDLQDGSVVAMTETGDVKQSLPVLDQSKLWDRLQQAFDSGRGSVRVLVVNDGGREMVVDTKTLHGSSL